MTLQELLSIMENRLINLTETRKQTAASGLLDQVVSLDNDIETTKTSIELISRILNSSTK